MIVFHKIDWHFLMEIDVNLTTQIMVSSITYWQHLNMVCPQQFVINGVVNPNTSNKTTKVKVVIIIEK
jgi:hypothetical protein